MNFMQSLFGWCHSSSLRLMLWLVLTSLPLSTAMAANESTPQPASSGAPAYIAEHWTSADGLPVNGIRKVHFDPASGYLWLATYDGLVRFDGHRFTVFRSGPRNPGLSGNRIYGLHATGDGQLWMLTVQQRLTRFDGRAFHAVGRADGLSDDVILGIFTDSRGTLWAATQHGLARRVAGNRFVTLAGTSKLRDIHDIQWSPGGILYVASRTGIDAFSHGHWLRHLGSADGIPVPTHAIAFDSNGRMWVAGDEHVVRQRADGSFATAISRTGARLLAADGTNMMARVGFTDYTVHADGRVDRHERAHNFQGTGGETLLRHAADGSTWRNRLDRLDRNGRSVFVSPCTITDFDFDASGAVWVATACDGLYQLRPRHITALTELGGKALGSVYGLAQAADGALWIGTLDHGIAILATDGTGRWLDQRNGIPAVGLHTIWIGRDGETWVGACRMNHATNCKTPLDWPRSIGRGSTVEAVHRARDGSLWIGGRSLWRRTAAGAWQPLPPVTGLHPGTSGMVRVIFESANGTLWFGTHGDGLLRRDPQGRLRLFTTADGLASNSIRALRQDRDGRLWVATQDRGLCRIENPQAIVHIACIDTTRGLWSDSLHQITFDAVDRMWLNSNRGIFAVSRTALEAVLDGHTKRVYPQVYTERDGLPSREGNGGVNDAGITLADGRMAFPTQNGVALFDPRDLPPSQATVRAVFESMTLPDGRNLDTTPQMTLARGTRSFMLHFTGLSPQLTAPVYFRYRVLPDSHWIDLGDVRQMSLSRLTPGHRIIELLAFGSSGNVGQAARITLHLPPYFYETSAFRIGVPLGLLLLLAWWMVHLRRTARQRQNLLEHNVAERTCELSEALTTVNQQRDHIERLAMSKTRFFANVSHELRTPLALLVGPLDDFSEGRAPSPELVASMQRNAHRLERLIGQLLDLERIDARRFPLRPQLIDLAKLVRESITAFAPLAAHENIALQLALPGHAVPVRGDSEQLMRVLGNLLSNALKFCPEGGRVQVTLTSDDDGVRLRVDDSGPGVQPEWRESIFNRFSQMGSEATRSREGAGLGLALCHEVATLHGGRLYATDSALGGAGFVFELPPPTRSPWVEGAMPSAPTAVAAKALAPANMAEPAPVESLAKPAVAATSPDVSASNAGDEDEGRPLVLLAEDNPDLRAYLSSILAETYRVSAAADGEIALRLARSEAPDLIVTDLMMPHLDGLGLARAVRAEAELAGVPIVFLTARASNADRVSGLEGGADYYLTKPFDSRVLLAQLASALRACQRLRERYVQQSVQLATASKPAPKSDFAGRLQATFSVLAHDPKCGVKVLAEALHVSEATLLRRCRHDCDASPGELLRRFRLERAHDLLAEGAGNVSEVAYAVGYTSLSAFGRAYREHFKHPPTLPPPRA